MSPLHFLLLLVPMMLTNTVRSQGDVTSFQVDSFVGLTYEGDAYIPPASYLLSLIRPDISGVPKTDSVGRVLYTTPVNFLEPGRQASFETTIQFRISSIGNITPGDGLTFFIVPVNSTTPTGGGGGGLGIFNAVLPNTPIFAVEFDIYSNKDVDDPAFHHIGIDINSKKSANVTSFENAIGQFVEARISYNATRKRIDVVARYNSETSKVSYVYDLKTLLPRQVQVGLSASVGPAKALFEVSSWYFSSYLVLDSNNVDVEEDAYIKQIVI